MTAGARIACAQMLLMASWTTDGLASNSGDLRFLADRSRLEFTVQFENSELSGRFGSFDVAVRRDSHTGRPEHLRVTVQTASADLNDREVNEEIDQPDWFDVVQFPVAVFASEEIRPRTGGNFLALGTLRLKGVSRSVIVPFTWDDNGSAASLSGALEMSRLDWNIGMGEWAADDTIANTVKVRFEVMLESSPE